MHDGFFLDNKKQQQPDVEEQKKTKIRVLCNAHMRCPFNCNAITFSHFAFALYNTVKISPVTYTPLYKDKGIRLFYYFNTQYGVPLSRLNTINGKSNS